ncbi:MAG: chloride channel protein [Porticoccaceae bacterium]|nr:chloride channel protein [Porticoccaceae bacterium]
MNDSNRAATETGKLAINNILLKFRLRLAHADALPQLAILGILSGFATGLVAVVFRLAMEWPLRTILPENNSEGFESLPPLLRFLLPLAGALVIGIIFHFNSKQAQSLGVGHVIDRYQNHQAHLPLRNAVLQFIGGILAVISGHSVGREGSAVHLGAASSSLLGQTFGLPNNSLRILVGCGVASAIAASFNTPLAGVILAMEVVLMEYTITGFIPIILAAVCGAVTSRICFGDTPAFDTPTMTMVSMLELPFLALCGIVVGLASAAMLTLHSYTLRFKNSPLALRLLAAGLIAGCAGVLVPQVMGIGYDTVELAMLGQASFTLLATIVVAKLLVSTTTLALGIPGGSIGPTLVIGACLGACLGFIGDLLTPSESAAIGFYAIVCMGAMMAGVLNAPLAALLALLELTYNPGILLPAMLVIVIACITTRMVSRLPGLFLIGRDTDAISSPISQALSRIGVTSVMTRDFVSHPRHLPGEAAKALLTKHPEWILIEGGITDLNVDVTADIAANTDDPQKAAQTKTQDDSKVPLKYILRAADLSRHLQSDAQQASIDLMGIPGERWRLHPIHPRATLDEVMKLIRRKNGYAVYVSQTGALSQTDVAGIITQEGIDRYYQ